MADEIIKVLYQNGVSNFLIIPKIILPKQLIKSSKNMVHSIFVRVLN